MISPGLGKSALGSPSAGEASKKLSAQFRVVCRELSVKSGDGSQVISAKMLKRRKRVRTPEKTVDTFSRKKPRGRPGVRPSEIRGRAENYRLIFGQIWDRLSEPLLRATTEKEITNIFDEYARPYTQQFVPALNALILKVIHDRRFPKRSGPQIKFMAASLAGLGRVSARRSRDICEQERKKKVHYIVRQDFYIECTCRYKGPALHGSCPKCGTDEILPPDITISSKRLIP